MKTRFPLILTAILFVVFVSFKNKNNNKVTANNKSSDAMEIMKNSCYACHNNDGKNEDAVKALNLDKWDDLSEIKKIGKREKICEEVSEGKMPPEKYLKYKPEKKLSAVQIKQICDWATEENARAMEE